MRRVRWSTAASGGPRGSRLSVARDVGDAPPSPRSSPTWQGSSGETCEDALRGATAGIARRQCDALLLGLRRRLKAVRPRRPPRGAASRNGLEADARGISGLVLVLRCREGALSPAAGCRGHVRTAAGDTGPFTSGRGSATVPQVVSPGFLLALHHARPTAPRRCISYSCGPLYSTLQARAVCWGAGRHVMWRTNIWATGLSSVTIPSAVSSPPLCWA